MMTRIQSLKTRERLTRRGRGRKEEERKVWMGKLERETGLEPATLSLEG